MKQKSMEKEIVAVNMPGMTKRFQMYGSKAAEILAKSQETEKKGERR